MRRCQAGDRPCPSTPSSPACSPLFRRAGCRRNHPSTARPCCPDQPSSYRIRPSSISARVRKVPLRAQHLRRSVCSFPELGPATANRSAYTKSSPKRISFDISPCCTHCLLKNLVNFLFSFSLAQLLVV